MVCLEGGVTCVPWHNIEQRSICIPDSRCDGKQQCKDKSDEKDCPPQLTGGTLALIVIAVLVICIAIPIIIMVVRRKMGKPAVPPQLQSVIKVFRCCLTEDSDRSTTELADASRANSAVGINNTAYHQTEEKEYQHKQTSSQDSGVHSWSNNQRHAATNDKQPYPRSPPNTGRPYTITSPDGSRSYENRSHLAQAQPSSQASTYSPISNPPNNSGYYRNPHAPSQSQTPNDYASSNRYAGPQGYGASPMHGYQPPAVGRGYQPHVAPTHLDPGRNYNPGGYTPSSHRDRPYQPRQAYPSRTQPASSSYLHNDAAIPPDQLRDALERITRNEDPRNTSLNVSHNTSDTVV